MPPPPHLQEQHDLLCVLLMIRLNAEHRALMVARRVPCLDDYLDRVNLLLWPRFKVGTGGEAAAVDRQQKKRPNVRFFEGAQH